MVEPTIRRQAARGPAQSTCCVFVVFGGTGDLARRKILPALYKLRRTGRIGDQCVILTVARDQGMDDAGYREMVKAAVDEDVEDAAAFARWCDTNIYYQGIGESTPADFEMLKARLGELERAIDIPPNRAYYMAIPPSAFPRAIEGLGEAGLNRSEEGWTRLVVEKPFGRDLDSARALNELVHRYFHESQIYRIDHYLGKETVQNLLVFRFANAVFESVWNRDHVQSVEITVAEDIGIEGRAGYYEQAGVVRDILQNHGIQLLSLVAMEVPGIFDADSIRQEKVKALRSITPITADQVVFGQYTRGTDGKQVVPGYREEQGVSPTSRTETFAAIRLEVNNWRWQGVPFYLRAGKRLARRVTEIVVKFRRPPVWMFAPMGGNQHMDLHSNTLRLTIQPHEGFALHFNVKEPGKPLKLRHMPLDFYYDEAYKELPEAYQTLLLDVMEGDQTLFVRADEVEEAWTLFAPLLGGDIPVESYMAGSWGPAGATELVMRDHQRWMTE